MNNNKKELDAIYEAFKSYIQEQDTFEILYSERMGYLRLLIDAPDEGAIVLETPEEMLEYLCSDVVSDVVYGPDNPKKSHSDMTLTDYEKTESRRRLSAILETLMDKETRSSFLEEFLEKYEGTDEED